MVQKNRTSAVRKNQGFPEWQTAELPRAPVFHRSQWTKLIGPGLLMAGANIGGGEWLFGPLVTAQYGGRILWLATVSILVQVCYNLAIMRYALYCGESALVGFCRTTPGAKFWIPFYLLIDLGTYWPYLAANAAVPLAAVILKRLPGMEDDWLVRGLSHVVFFTAFVPLVFGGKIYNSLQRVMIAKLVLTLGYLSLIAIFWTSWDTKWEIVSGLYRFGSLPEGEFSWATLAAFAAIAGAGGLSNISFSSLVRDKGWGMGQCVGAIPSAIGGKTVKLSHTGKVFEINEENLKQWKQWLKQIRRDQFFLWAPACTIGVILPAMVSYEFIRGLKNVDGNAVAAMAARGIADRHGEIFWFLTLLCGFAILFPTQITNLDGVSRRWTDVIWMGMKRLHHLEGNKVKYVYYGILAAYAVWGTIALRLTPNAIALAVATGVMLNFALGFSALHVLYINLRVMPKELAPPWIMRIGLVCCAVYYIGISSIAFTQYWPKILAWLF